jgi:hypothetical protein
MKKVQRRELDGCVAINPPGAGAGAGTRFICRAIRSAILEKTGAATQPPVSSLDFVTGSSIITSTVNSGASAGR